MVGAQPPGLAALARLVRTMSHHVAFAPDAQSSPQSQTPHHNTRIKRQLTGLNLEGADTEIEADVNGAGATVLDVGQVSNPLARSPEVRDSQGNLRKSILKIDHSRPVVSPRTPLTRNLSFVDQAQGGPLKEVRLYEKPPKLTRPVGQVSGYQQQQQEQDENSNLAMGLFAAAIVVVIIIIVASN